MTHLEVCLERTVELDAVRLRLREWPGLNGAVVHVPDPLSPNDAIITALASAFAPRYRVLSLSPRGDSAYQVDATDLLGVMDQFGFEQPTLVAEGLGCVAALLVAAWYSDRVGRLILIDPTYVPGVMQGIAARALRDCPPDWGALQRATTCPLLHVDWNAAALREVEDFLTGDSPAMRRTSHPSSPAHPSA